MSLMWLKMTSARIYKLFAVLVLISIAFSEFTENSEVLEVTEKNEFYVETNTPTVEKMVDNKITTDKEDSNNELNNMEITLRVSEIDNQQDELNLRNLNPIKSNSETKFLAPEIISNLVDKFVKDDVEYLFVKATFAHKQVNRICQDNYKAHIAIIKDVETANFLAEALSETDLDMDTLWTAGVNITQTGVWSWYWKIDDYIETMASEIINLMSINGDVDEVSRQCLGFGKSFNQIPQFRPLHCHARRSIICQRPIGGIIDNNSTHSHWIKLGRRQYKIFYSRLTWEQASNECLKNDIDSNLAVITHFSHAQILGKYLLVGRPSLENAWIGAKYDNKQNQYYYEQEFRTLPNITDNKGYPPWRNGIIQKAGGCVLLDRHIANASLFVEARCERLRSYICYKPLINNTLDSFTDLFIEPFGYRVHYNQLSWEQAENYCRDFYGRYNARLVEIRNPEQVHHLLYTMGENKTAVQHMWLGGKYDKTAKTWKWISDNKIIENRSGFNLIKNDSYQKPIDDHNICLNMDRENHVTALYYGTLCSWKQPFVCSFASDELRKLQEDENIEDSPSYR